MKTVAIFDGREEEVIFPLGETVEHYKQEIRKVFPEIESDFMVIFAGNVLKDSITLHEAGVKENSRLRVFYRKSKNAQKSTTNEIDVEVINTAIKPFFLTMKTDDTVFNLRQKISEQIGLTPELLTIVFNGQVLLDDISLGFYKISNKSKIFFTLKKVVVDKKPRPSHLIDQLYKLVSTLLTKPKSKHDTIMLEISELIENPILQAFARLDRDTQQMIDDALMILESIPSYAYSNYESIAAMNDMTMTQYETTAEGMRALEEAMLNDDDEEYSSIDDGIFDLPTVITPSRKISNKPLPTCWAFDNSSFFSSSASIQPLREVFARQIRALKKLGFNDEPTILKVLNETAGNVPKAAQILFGKQFYITY